MRWQKQQGDLEEQRREQRKEHHEKRHTVGTDTGRQGTLPERLVRAYFEEADPLTETLLLSWLSFGATFGITRFITHGIRGEWLPLKNVSAGDKHLHHYNFGILLLAGVGLMAVRLPRRAGRRPVAGIAYGMGIALIADEAALLLNLEDVYWKDKGRTSINIVAGILTGLGAYVVAEPFFDDAIREIRRGIRRIG
ncbi:MAG: hypothetical protein ACRDMV_08115 [Streptosporangiales bacterium]